MISFIGRLLDFLFPRSCAICDKRLAVEEDVICATCNMHLDRTNYSKKPYDNEMAKTFWKLLPIEKAAALFYFQGGSPQSNIVYKLKYYDRPDIGIALGELTAVEMKKDCFFDNIDFIIPVPIAKNRRKQRGYNQSEKIAEGVAKISGIVVRKDIVDRDKFKGSQTHLGTIDRQKNVKGVFHLRKREDIKGKHILIIDDICTTGATIISLGEELAKAGNVRISVLTLGFARS